MSEPIRILQIVTQMNCGGAESRLIDIYRNIDRDKVQFDFYTCRMEQGSFDSEILNMGGNIYYNAPLNISSFYAIPKRFRDFCQSHQEYKVVHCHMNQWCSPILKGVMLAGIPVRIAHSRTSLEKTNMKNIIKNIVKIGITRYATHMFAVSRKAGEWLFGKSMVKNGNVLILQNAIDCKKFAYTTEVRQRLREEFGLNDQLTLIHIGNIRPEKNHSYLLKVFAEIKKKYSYAKLIIVGADNLNGEIQNESENLGISSDTLFLGMRTDVPDILQAGDVFVFPSFYEGFPGAVLEAQAAGLPCIISNTITDEVCILNSTKQLPITISPEIWAEEILKYKNFNRHDTYDEICASGYDIHMLVDKLTDFYLNVI